MPPTYKKRDFCIKLIKNKKIEIFQKSDFFFFIKSAFSGVLGFKTDWKSCKTEFFEYSFGSPRDRPKILDFIFAIRLFLVRFESVDVRIPRVLSIFHKICMGAHNHPPKLGYGGCNSKIQY